MTDLESILTNKTLMALLTIVLPERSDNERAMFYLGENNEQPGWGLAETADMRRLSIKAAQGQVLPVLIYAGRVCLKHKDHLVWKETVVVNDVEVPDAETILEQAFLLLNERPFKEHLKGVFSRARRAPDGPPRFFYALASSQICFAPDGSQDDFWPNKSSALMWALLSLAARLPMGPLSPELHPAACALNVNALSKWERKGWEKLDHNLPPSVMSSLFTQINVKVHWDFSSAHDEIRSMNDLD